jgi:hypothetical protein
MSTSLRFSVVHDEEVRVDQAAEIINRMLNNENGVKAHGASEEALLKLQQLHDALAAERPSQ